MVLLRRDAFAHGFAGTIPTKHIPVFYAAKCEVGWYGFAEIEIFQKLG